MKEGDALLIFGGGMLQVSLIKTANCLGYRTVVIDPNPNAPGRVIADEFVVVGGDDFDSTLEIAKRNRVSGVVTSATDKPLVMMARIARRLNLAFPSECAIRNTINKFELKKTLQANDIPCAKGYLCGLEEIEARLEQNPIPFPLIIKPIDSSGSRGVFYCDSISSLRRVFQESLKHTSFDKVLIEEFMEGPEISVECLVQNAVVHVIQVTDKTTTPFPYNVELGHVQPSRHIQEHGASIRKVIASSVRALKLDDCALHPELKITKSGVRIVEIGPRLGGDFITSHLVPLSTGINMEEQLINIATRRQIDVTPTLRRFSAVVFFDFKRCPTGRVGLADHVRHIREYVHDFELYYSDSDELPVVTNSMERHGHIVISSDSLDELLHIKSGLCNDE
jgi:biotin carboxylase